MEKYNKEERGSQNNVSETAAESNHTGGPSQSDTQLPKTDNASEPTTGAGIKSAIAPAERRYPSWGDFFALIGVFLAAQLLAMLPLMILRLLGVDISQELTTLIVYVVSMSVALGFVIWQLRHHGIKPRVSLVSKMSITPALILWGVVMILASGVVIEPLLDLFPSQYLDMLNQTIGRGGLAIVTTVVLAPLFEETIFRGLILGGIRQKRNSFTAVLISAAIFGVIHVIPQQVINAFVVGIILGYIYVRTSSLLAVVIIHAINNGLAYLQTILFDGQLTTYRSIIDSQVWYAVLYGVSAAIFIVSAVAIFRQLNPKQVEMKLAKENKTAKKQQ